MGSTMWTFGTRWDADVDVGVSLSHVLEATLSYVAHTTVPGMYLVVLLFTTLHTRSVLAGLVHNRRRS